MATCSFFPSRRKCWNSVKIQSYLELFSYFSLIFCGLASEQMSRIVLLYTPQLLPCQVGDLQDFWSVKCLSLSTVPCEIMFVGLQLNSQDLKVVWWYPMSLAVMPLPSFLRQLISSFNKSSRIMTCHSPDF